MTTALTTQTLESSFALKLHALLCRSYVKGRDWYDFVWYVTRKIRPDLALLEHALDQQGPWAGRRMNITWAWMIETLRVVIGQIDWSTARQDVQRFLPLREQESLSLWGSEFFLYYADMMETMAP
mgnify:FL=1